jgi:hypothetical protein
VRRHVCMCLILYQIDASRAERWLGRCSVTMLPGLLHVLVSARKQSCLELCQRKAIWSVIKCSESEKNLSGSVIILGGPCASVQSVW